MPSMPYWGDDDAELVPGTARFGGLNTGIQRMVRPQQVYRVRTEGRGCVFEWAWEGWRRPLLVPCVTE